MSVMASQITSLTIVYSTAIQGADKRKTSKLCVTGLCDGNSPLTIEFPTQWASNTENVSIWWHHDVDFRQWLLSYVASQPGPMPETAISWKLLWQRIRLKMPAQVVDISDIFICMNSPTCYQYISPEAAGKVNLVWEDKHGLFNSLWPSDTKWWQRSGSTLAQVMACCHTAPSHYLNHSWLIISEIQWH